MFSQFRLDRKALSQVFKDPRTLRAFENLLQNAVDGVAVDPSTLVQAVNDADAAAQGVNLYAPYMNGSFKCYRMT